MYFPFLKTEGSKIYISQEKQHLDSREFLSAGSPLASPGPGGLHKPVRKHMDTSVFTSTLPSEKQKAFSRLKKETGMMDWPAFWMKF